MGARLRLVAVVQGTPLGRLHLQWLLLVLVRRRLRGGLLLQTPIDVGQLARARRRIRHVAYTRYPELAAVSRQMAEYLVHVGVAAEHSSSWSTTVVTSCRESTASLCRFLSACLLLRCPFSWLLSWLHWTQLTASAIRKKSHSNMILPTRIILRGETLTHPKKLLHVCGL